MNKITFLFFTLLFSLNLLAQETSVTSFVLVNADNDTDIIEITEGAEINLLDYPNTQFNIRANTSGLVGSVRLSLVGAVSGAMTENVAPYALFGDFAGDFNGEFFPVGTYSMTAVSYSESGLNGEASEPLTLNFDVVEEPLQRPYITTWKTNNPGTSEDNQITVPTRDGETYDYRIDWGDGNSDSGVTSSITHTYETAGVYQVSISGDFPSILFNDPFNNGTGDGDKVLSVDQWGDIDWKYVAVAYAGCDNLDIKATDIPDFSKVSFTNAMFLGCTSLVGNESMNLWNFSSVVSMNSMFDGATSFNQDIGNWDVSNVTDFTLMFSNTTFNQNLENWNVGNAQDMGGMFNGVKLSEENYDSLLVGWSTQQLQNDVTFFGGNSQYCQGEEARQTLIDDFGWTITDEGKSEDCVEPQRPFITTWKTDNRGASEDNEITISVDEENGFIYDFNVDWGDGHSSLNVNGKIVHTYETPGTYHVSISGEFPAILINGNGNSPFDPSDAEKLVSINQWGDIKWLTMKQAFEFGSNLELDATDVPDLSQVTSLDRMFGGCIQMHGNQSLENWDVSNVNDMAAMFASCGIDQDISNWNVSNVQTMVSLFANTPNFNGDVSNWNVTGVTEMNNIFSGKKISREIYDSILVAWSSQNLQNGVIFDGGNSIYCEGEEARQSLIDNFGWTIIDAGKCLDVDESQRPFITTWKTDNEGLSDDNEVLIFITGTSQVNIDWGDGTIDKDITQPITHTYDVPGTYQVAISGNYPRIIFGYTAYSYGHDRNKLVSVDQWGDTQWTTMEYAFKDCQNVQILAEDVPDLSLVTSMRSMFENADTMNDDISSWDFSSVINMFRMFLWADGFNQDISKWNFPNNIGLGDFLSGATSFDQDLSNLDLSKISSMAGFLERSGLSQENYDKTLIGWANQSSIPFNLRVDVEGTSYCNGANARQKLVSEFGWNIFDGGYVCPSTIPFITSWKTDNEGYSEDNQITFPIQSPAEVTIDWGDGTTSNNVKRNITHTYEIPGIYRISVSGIMPNLRIGPGVSYLPNNRNKLLSVDQWGDMKWVGLESAFQNCLNVQILAEDAPNLSNVSSLRYMFSNADSMNNDISFWDFSTITNMNGMFFKADSYNQNLTDWNFRRQVDMSAMFSQAKSFDQDLGGLALYKMPNLLGFLSLSGLSKENYDKTLIGWATQNFIPRDISMQIDDVNFCQGEEARLKLIDDFGWTFIDGGKSSDCLDNSPFIMTWKTDNPESSNPNQITIPTFSGKTYNYSVDWGDGNSDTGVTGDITHTYANPGTYQVSISGNFPRIYFNDYNQNSDNSEKIIAINQWGGYSWSSMEHAFSGCINLDVKATDIPDLSLVERLSYMFSGCRSLIGNPSFENWDIDAVKYLSGMFKDADKFNQNIGDWDTEGVIWIDEMFWGASNFNHDISGWDVRWVEFYFALFRDATSFNQNLGSWNLRDVAFMNDMFLNSNLSDKNYDKTLIGWAEKISYQNGVIFHGGSAQYCLSEQARQKLINDFGWTITDGGKALDCNPCPTTQITLSTQQQVDNFATTYDVANCTFEGGILIEGTDITNLDGLYTLTNIQGPLTIRNTAISNLNGLFSLNNPGWVILIEGNSVMTDIDGLSSITNSSSLIISDNALLTNVDGLASLERVSSDLIIKNNESLANLDGLSSLLTISDSFVIKSNASLNNLGGLSSLLLVDNDLVIESNRILTNIDGLSNLDIVGHSLSIQSNASLTNLDGLSSVIEMYGDLKIINNDILTNLDGLASLNSIGGELNISENDALSNCAIDAVCNSSIIVGGTVTISRNTGNCIDEIVALASCIEVIEGEADLIAATFLEGSRNPLPTGPILRAEEGNREIYMKFDLSSFNGTISNAELTMQVASDPGNGDLKVFLASDSNWTETGLNGTNKPVAVGSALALISGTHSLGQTKSWNLDVSNLSTGEELTLIVKHSNGNDVAFASDESSFAPELLITSSVVPEIPRPFVTTWKTDNSGISDDNQITLPINGFIGQPFTVDWGDGTSDIAVSEDITHTYEGAGLYMISISGSFKGFDFSMDSDKLKLISVDQWGDLKWGDVSPRFSGCANLDVLATDIPDFSNVTSLDFMFTDCRSLVGNSSMNNWDVSNVVEMEFVFNGATSFNQNISSWNVGSVNDMGHMFDKAMAFNQNLSRWDVSNVRNMVKMFSMATSFNQDISAWDVGNVRSVYFMFEGAIAFDQNLGEWNISNLEFANELFEGTSLSTENYDGTLMGWSVLDVANGETQIPQNMNFDGGGSQYCLGEAARQRLINDFGWTITDGGKLANCNPVIRDEANLIDATYLEGSRNPAPTGPILRAEEGNREVYMKFDLNSFKGQIDEAQLTMQVASDPGNGTLEVFLGSNSNWTETGLNGSNKPTAIGNALASISGTHSLGQTKTWNLDVSQISGGGFVTLIVKHRNGNDVAFASDETDFAPQLIISAVAAGVVSSNSLSLSPNPASEEIAVGFEVPIVVSAIFVYDVSGKLVHSVPAGEAQSEGDYPMDVSGLPSGMYFVRTFDADGIPHQKSMVIEN